MDETAPFMLMQFVEPGGRRRATPALLRYIACFYQARRRRPKKVPFCLLSRRQSHRAALHGVSTFAMRGLTLNAENRWLLRREPVLYLKKISPMLD